MRRYIHVFHPCNLFDETFASYRAASFHPSRMVAVPSTGLKASSPEWQDPSNAIIVWWWNTPGLLGIVPPKRRAAYALWYGESVGPTERLCPHQAGVLRGFLPYLKVPDTVFVGTPSAAEFLKPYCRRVFYVPFGYSAKVMGSPDWSRSKRYDFAYCGYPIGRREWIVPALRRRFGGRLCEFFGPFGKARKEIYDQCRAALYIPHSLEPSFPAMRIPHMAASSAVLVTEPKDAWPAVAGRHYAAVPEADEKDVDKFVHDVEETLKLPLEKIARAAHADLSKYTVERSVEMMAAALP